MRIYSAANEETLRARKLLRDWTSEGFLTREQYQRLEQETVSDLRTTNNFLHLVLFVFTLISVVAAVGLFFTVFLPRTFGQTTGVFMLIFAAACYVAAEVAVSRFRLHHYGIEEALVVCSVGFLCAGMQATFFSGATYSPRLEMLIPAAGAVLSLWIWHRFGLWYAFPAAMIFVLLLPGHWTSSPPARHGIVAVFYVAGLICVAAAHKRHRFDYLDDSYSIVEALLWLGIYMAINLQISSLTLSARWWGGTTQPASEFGKPFYWTTWLLCWFLPPIVLARGIRRKDRFVMAIGVIVAVLTFVTNKPYLGWPRHTWDPMILGILLTGAAFFIRRWLASGTGGIRHGFTAARLSAKDKHWMNTGSSVFGLVSPHSITPKPQSPSSDFHFGGGSSGGGGASGDF